MAFTEDQQRIIDSHFRLDDLGQLDGPTTTLELNKREARLLLEALDHYRDTRCPFDGNGDECAMMFWTESVHSGALQRTCIGCCDRLIAEILSVDAQKVFGLAKDRPD
ncbi:MAG: hypothetical protein HYY30_01380 [Chloroflexi bacterium]|nr:hypothetical protein [Chloroflexota bacterium]